MRCGHLVTGGAGFLGSHLVDRLKEDDPECKILVVDDFSSGKWDNLHESLSAGRYHMLQIDDCTHVLNIMVQSLGWIRHAMHHFGECSGVKIWNLASPASPPKYKDAPIQCLEASSLGIHNVVSLADQLVHLRPVIIHASTSEVYGDPEVHPQLESYAGNVQCQGPRSMYDEGKRYAEAYLYSAASHMRLDVRIARIFNTYGPRAPLDGRVVASFVQSIVNNEPMQIHGDGQQTRSFCYVSDMIDGLVKLGHVDNNIARIPLTVNLGNTDEHSISRLCTEVATAAEQFRAGTVASASVEFVNQPCAHDPRRRNPDITRAQELLGWEPRVQLNSGLIKTLQAAMESSPRPAQRS